MDHPATPLSSAAEQHHRVVELQEMIVRQNNELSSAHIKLLELGAKQHEVEESLAASQKELQRVQELNTRLQRDIREVGGRGCIYVGTGVKVKN